MILAERDLAATPLVLIQAHMNYAKALIALELVEGTILERHRINFYRGLPGSLRKTPARPEVCPAGYRYWGPPAENYRVAGMVERQVLQ